jgi:hypothetical protein
MVRVFAPWRLGGVLVFLRLHHAVYFAVPVLAVHDPAAPAVIAIS